MNESTLWILCGCPASGKSTWANEQVKENDGVVISRDEIRFNMLTDDDDYFDKENLVFKEYISYLVISLERNANVYADATHLNWFSRKKLIEAVKNCHLRTFIKFNCVVFNTPLDVCLERNSKRTGRARVPNEAIHNMYHRFSSPKDDPFNYDEILEVNQ